ncbi:MAG: lipoate--protein ligase [Lachnospiraceae bacterium]|nr:lipoate--protein ligase [Lachnospiraceae bacterium]
MINKAQIIESTVNDPYTNLAVETVLHHTCPEDCVVMYLWQNENTVVIGRNQNAYGECNTENIDAAGVRIARRTTGGGAVFHDLGNLNFSFIYSKDNSDDMIPVEIIKAACRSFGIDAEITGRNDVTCMGRKFSGNAFCHHGNMILAHGTIMVDLDTSKLSGYLNVSREKLASKGVKSVSSRVINLAEVCPGLTISAFKDALKKAYSESFSGITEVISFDDIRTGREALALAEKYASREWIFGGAKDFNVNMSRRFSWGGCEIKLLVRDHRIEESLIYSDAMDPGLIADIAAALKGRLFEYRSVSEALIELKKRPRDEDCCHMFSLNPGEMISDILELMK